MRGRMATRLRNAVTGTLLAAALALMATPAGAQLARGKVDPDGYNSLDDIRKALPEYFQPTGELRARPADVPDIFGHGAVLTVGSVNMKVTNFGHCGNFFTNLS